MFGIILVQALAGASGGLIRGLVGITKAKEFNPTTFKFEWKIFGFTILVSMLTGLMSGLIMNVDWRVCTNYGLRSLASHEDETKVQYQQTGLGTPIQLY